MDQFLAFMKDLGTFHYFLGVEVHRTPSDLHLSETKYISDLLEQTRMGGTKPCVTLATSRIPLNDATEYHIAVGELQWLTITRPEISFSVNHVSQVMHQSMSNRV